MCELLYDDGRMLRLLLAVSLTIITGVEPRPHSRQTWPPSWREPKTWWRGSYPEKSSLCCRRSHDKMKAAIDANGLRRLIPSLVVQFGAFKSQNGARTESQGGCASCSCRARSSARTSTSGSRSTRSIASSASASVRPSRPLPTRRPAMSRRRRFVTRRSPSTPAVGRCQGTLSRPVGAGPFPAVVLVHGSGPNDRDSSFGPNKLFRDLAEGLASRGIAVLRYDKRTRTHAGRVAPLLDFTVKEEVVDDAVAAVKKMRETREFGPTACSCSGTASAACWRRESPQPIRRLPDSS